ncbi:MAG: site-specific integrase [Microbacterium sp. 14-71-5]|jgi:integrase|nr:MAG: site-specific integrase [Microbacterium sp. 14-71-5]
MAWTITRTVGDGRTRYTGLYRDPQGRTRSAGTFARERDALRAAERSEDQVSEGKWLDPAAGRITFGQYAEQVWLPSRHLEVTTRAGYRSYLRIHFVPFFGSMQLARIMPSTVQEWVNQAGHPRVVDGKQVKGLSPRSIGKYHVMLHSIFARAVRDRLIAFNPCEATELPKVVAKPTRTLTPEEFASLLEQVPARFKALVMTDIETGLRWGELVALRPRHIDFLRSTIRVEETIVEVSSKDSPTGERMLVKPYPKDDEARTLKVSRDLLEVLSARIAEMGLRRDDLLFPSREVAGGDPLSRATFNKRYWKPAVQRCGLDFDVRMHDLRHAHASWLLAGGADLKSVMARMGHAQIQGSSQLRV